MILNWNGRKFLEKFLPPLLLHSEGEVEIIVADNASTDDSLDFLKNNYPAIRTINLDRNSGFAGGYNLALKQTEADYYVLLNSDIQVTPDWIMPVIRLMEKDPLIAACQPKIRSYSEPSRFEYAGAAGGFLDQYGYPFCRGRIFQELEEDTGQYDDETEIFWATGACMFVKAKIFHEMGGLDEDFFAHMEEIDFCWRLQNNGYKIMYCPGSKVYHIGGGTLPKASWRKTFYNFRNNLILLYKNLPDDMLLRVFATRFIMDGIAAMRFLFTAGFKDFFAVMKAHFSFYGSFSKIREKRKMLHHRPMRNTYRKNMVFEHFLNGKKKFSDLDQENFIR